MEKNIEHLQNLLNNNQITSQMYDQAVQNNEELTVVVDSSHAFSLLHDIKRQGLNHTNLLTKLQFFHTWVFYYLYSADHKFLKAILKNKFPFIRLFQSELEKLRTKKSLQVVRNVYGDKTASLIQQRHDLDSNKHYAYTIPIVFTKGQYQVNWTLIERTLNYVKNRLLELVMPTERHIIVAKYNLEEVCKQDNKAMIKRVWDNKYIGNRHVVIEPVASNTVWDKPIDLTQGKQKEPRQFAEYIRRELQNCYSQRSLQINETIGNGSSFISLISILQDQNSEFKISGMSQIQQMRSFEQSQFQKESSSQQKIEKKQMTLTTQEYYFIKQGQLQSQRFNRNIFKCRKERHFVDFGKKRRDDIEPIQYSIANQKQTKVNTIFDVPEQSLTLSPVSYNQYQVLQQSCYHFLNLNEFMLIEKFIEKFFKSTTCLLQKDNQLENEWVPSIYSTRLLMTQDQIWAEVQSSGQVEQRSTRDTLKCRLALVREALTAPSACRDYDYERLEFYGDSIIGFLVILELFLLNQSNTEGDLDFRRIERVSNENFYKINKNNEFYRFMITDPHYVFSGFTPAGFESFEQNAQIQLHYQNKVTQKTYNELNNKIKELKILQERLRTTSTQDDDLKQMFLRGELYSLVKIILKDDQMVQKVAYKLTSHQSKIHDREHPKNKVAPECKCSQASLIFEKLVYRQDRQSVLKAVRILGIARISPLRLLRYCTEVVHNKISTQIQKQRESRDKKTAENQRMAKDKKRPVYYKQLADVVESVVGAVTIACGINLTQEFLLELGVLKYDQNKLREEMDLLVVEARRKEAKLFKPFYQDYNLQKVEQIIGYNFKCKTFIVTALMHKSYIDQSVEQALQMRLDDYERLEFLGDSILNYMVAKHFFLSSQNDDVRKMPKELHKMKTAVINNALLSLIVIEKEINNFIIYNKKAESFKHQFEKFVSTVHQMVGSVSTETISKRPKEERDAMALDLDELYEHNLKIFGDVFESLIGAVFLDCRDSELTWKVLEKLIMPYIKVYADLDTMQDHSRTKLLELWNQRPYTKRFKCTHESSQVQGKDEITLTALLIGPYGSSKHKHAIFSETFKKDAKNKTRAFYKTLFGIVTKFIEQVDKKGQSEENRLMEKPELVWEGLRKIINTQRTLEHRQGQERQMQLQSQI